MLRTSAVVALALAFSTGCGNGLGSSADERAVAENLREHLPDPDYKVMRWWPAIDSQVAVDAEAGPLRRKVGLARFEIKKARDNLKEISTENRREDRVEKQQHVTFGNKKEREKQEADASLRIEEMEAAADALEVRLKKLDDSPTIRICRVKFRAKNKQGGPEIYDRMYEIRHGTAYLCNETVRDACLREFPG